MDLNCIYGYQQGIGYFSAKAFMVQSELAWPHGGGHVNKKIETLLSNFDSTSVQWHLVNMFDIIRDGGSFRAS